MRQAHAPAIRWKERLNSLWPFNECHCVCVEKFFEAECEKIAYTVQAVQIEMVNHDGSLIDVEVCECRALRHVLNPQSFEYSLHKRRLASAELAIQSDDITRLKTRRELSAPLKCVFSGCYSASVHFSR